MFEPEEEAGEVREENSGEPISETVSEPVSETEPEAINDTQSEAQPEAQSEPEAAAPEAEAGSAQSDEAQKLREEYPEQVYADARYEPEGESTVPPRYYCPPERPAKEAREKKSGRSHVFLKAACLALACALLGGLAGGEPDGEQPERPHRRDGDPPQPERNGGRRRIQRPERGGCESRGQRRRVRLPVGRAGL